MPEKLISISHSILHFLLLFLKRFFWGWLVIEKRLTEIEHTIEELRDSLRIAIEKEECPWKEKK